MDKYKTFLIFDRIRFCKNIFKKKILQSMIITESMTCNSQIVENNRKINVILM
jgi:hypothetical protein